MSNKIGNDTTFIARQLVDAITFVIDNSFIKFNGNLYRQVMGIPMGTNCAPYLANIFLHGYEKDFISYPIASGKTEEAMKLSNTFRFQDDRIVMNDNEFFDTRYKDPRELTLVNTNTSTRTVTFLDLGITLHHGKFKHHLYDKRNDFDFSVINYPLLSGNIPKIPSYGVYMSQLLRLCRICSESKKFMVEVKNLNKKLIGQGFVLPSLKRKFKLYCNKYIHIYIYIYIYIFLCRSPLTRLKSHCNVRGYKLLLQQKLIDPPLECCEIVICWKAFIGEGVPNGCGSRKKA